MTTGTGDGHLTVDVDGFGQFSFAQYNPVGTDPNLDTTFDSDVAIRFGSQGTRTYFSNSGGTPTTSGTSTRITSAFTIQNLSINLTQSVQPLRNSQRAQIGSVLSQQYTLRNTGASTANFELIRYYDGDLTYSGGLGNDGGGRIVYPTGDEVLFETEQGGNPTTSTTFIGIDGSGGSRPSVNRFEVDRYSGLRTNIQNGTLLDDTITNDSNGDGFIDTGAGYDVTLGLLNVFSVAPGASAIYTTRTLFGTGAPSSVNLPRIAINNASVIEGQSGTSQLVFTVTRAGFGNQQVLVDYSTSDGVAIAGSDYNATTGVLTFDPGVNSQNITVTVNGDRAIEPDETFFVDLTSATNATINDGQAAGTITNDDFGPAFLISDVTVAEGNNGTTNAVFTVTLAPTSTQPATVAYSTGGGTATVGVDYTAASGVLTFPAGSSTQTFTVAVLGELLVESDETFQVTLSNAVGAILEIPQAIGTIDDDDTGVGATINDVSILEGASGTTNMVFNVSLLVPPAQAVSVAYTTADVTATAGSDYTAASGTLNFAAGVTSQSLTVAVQGDGTVEQDETFRVLLSSNTIPIQDPDGGATGTIQTDDLPILTLLDAEVNEGREGTTNLVFTVRMNQPFPQPISAQFSTANSTALAGSDYIAQTGIVTVPPGTTRGLITIAVKGDTVVEPNEYFNVNLSNAGIALIADGQAVGTIANDDSVYSSVPAKISISDATTTVSTSGVEYAIFTVALTQANARTVTVKYSTVNNTAQAGVNYTAASGTLLFTPGTTTQSIAVRTNGSSSLGIKNFFVNLSAPANGTLVDPQGRGTINVVLNAADQQIKDDGDFGYFQSGAWTQSTNGLSYQLDHRTARGTTANRADWSFQVTPGRYEVFTTWIPFSNRATNAPFAILDGVTSRGRALVNQRVAPAGQAYGGVTWKSLGTYTINSNQLTVRLNGTANGFVVADAIRIVRVGNTGQAQLAASPPSTLAAALMPSDPASSLPLPLSQAATNSIGPAITPAADARLITASPLTMGPSLRSSQTSRDSLFALREFLDSLS